MNEVFEHFENAKFKKGTIVVKSSGDDDDIHKIGDKGKVVGCLDLDPGILPRLYYVEFEKNVLTLILESKLKSDD